jgi:hypothetical protein
MRKAEKGDVVRIAHPFYLQRPWLVINVTESFTPGIYLYHVQLLQPDGKKSPINIIHVEEKLVKENLGRYEEWLTTLQN